MDNTILSEHDRCVDGEIAPPQSPPASVADLTEHILTALLDWKAFDPYWLDLPVSQRDLAGADFLRNRIVPSGAADEIAELLVQFVAGCVRRAA